MRRLHDRSRCARSSAGAGDRPEEFANFIELSTSPTGPRSFQLLVGDFQLLVGGD